MGKKADAFRKKHGIVYKLEEKKMREDKMREEIEAKLRKEMMQQAQPQRQKVTVGDGVRIAAGGWLFKNWFTILVLSVVLIVVVGYGGCQVLMEMR